MTDYLEPWVPVADGHREALERELSKELASGHELAGERCRALARREDRDDVLFEITGGRVAEVHLTWKGRAEEGRWPSTTIYATLDEWKAERMATDHEEFSQTS